MLAIPNPAINFAFGSTFDYLIVGNPAENKIVIRSSFLNSSFNQTICANQSFLWNDIQQNTPGAYKDTFPSFFGCDSVVTLNLTVTPLPNKSTTTAGNTITATQAGATYQWINCVTNTPIIGEIAQSFTPTSNGSYKVAVKQNNCSDTSACVVINALGINDFETHNNHLVFPNPAHEYFTVNINSMYNDAKFILFSLDGKEIFSQKLNTQSTIIKVPSLSIGLYQYQIIINGKIELGKISIE